MKPMKFAGYHILGQPADWNEELYGECGGLPVVETPAQIDFPKTFTSVWKPTWRDRIAILFGHKVTLMSVGVQAPVLIETRAVPELAYEVEI